MTRTRRGRVLGAAAVAFVFSGLACVDLFHSTDFETLCAREPNHVDCGGRATTDGAVSDVVTEPDVADAARPHPDFCAWTSAEARTQAQRACAWLGACEGPLGESAFGPCVVRAQLAFDCGANPSLRPLASADDFWGCLSTVKSCGDVDACVFPGGVQSCAAVPTGSSTACGTLAANASARLKCAGPAGRAVGVEPCVLLGKTCVIENMSNATCAGSLGFDTCASDECSGSAAVDCTSAGTRTLDRGVDCKLSGGGLCTVVDGGPVCRPGPIATSCGADAVPACDGTIVTSCVGGKEMRVDCNRLGLPCDVSQTVAPYDPTAACIKRGADACAEIDSCVGGTTLRSCGRGALFEINCQNVGLGACTVDGSGTGRCAAP